MCPLKHFDLNVPLKKRRNLFGMGRTFTTVMVLLGRLWKHIKEISSREVEGWRTILFPKQLIQRWGLITEEACQAEIYGKGVNESLSASKYMLRVEISMKTSCKCFIIDHINTAYTWSTHFCRKLSFVAITRFLGSTFCSNLVHGGTKTFYTSGIPTVYAVIQHPLNKYILQPQNQLFLGKLMGKGSLAVCRNHSYKTLLRCGFQKKTVFFGKFSQMASPPPLLGTP